MAMIVHDLKNPTVSLQNGLELVINRLKNSELYKFYHSNMTAVQR